MIRSWMWEGVRVCERTCERVCKGGCPHYYQERILHFERETANLTGLIQNQYHHCHCFQDSPWRFLRAYLVLAWYQPTKGIGHNQIYPRILLAPSGQQYYNVKSSRRIFHMLLYHMWTLPVLRCSSTTGVLLVRQFDRTRTGK